MTKRYQRPLMKSNWTLFKIGVFITCFGFSQSSALALQKKPDSPVVELSLAGVTLKDALHEIEQQTDYSLVINNSRLPSLDRVVTVSLREEKIQNVMDKLLEGTDITYVIRKKQITLIPPSRQEKESHSPGGGASLTSAYSGIFPMESFPTDYAVVIISGKVTEESGQPLPGVNILEKGTTNGTVTDTDGAYRLTVTSESSTLVFSFIGYLTQEVAISGQTTVDVKMAPDTKTLSEIVVVGYGTQEKNDVTGSISSVKGSDFENLPVAAPQQALQGRTAGVNIVRNGGAPGDAGTIRIRGTGTVNDANPLIVIDGVPAGGLADVNPNDIESLEVLKDASASAIYGTRAANGVVIVTTKRGKFGQRLKMNVSGYTGVSNRIKSIDVLDAPTLAMLKRERYVNDGLPINPIWEDPQYLSQKTDWQKELLGQGSINNLDLSLSGGSDKSTFAVSAGRYDEDGMIKNYYFQRNSFRINSDHKINEKLKIGQNLQITNQKSSSSLGSSAYNLSAQDGLVWSAIRFHPGLPVKNADGTYSSSQVSSEFGDINNPIFTADTQDRGSTHTRILGSVNGDFEILKGLHARANIAIDANFDDSREFNIIVLDQIRTNSRNSLTVKDEKNYSLLQEYFLSYGKEIGRHNLGIVSGFSQQTFNYTYSGAQRKDFPSEDPSQRYLSAGQAITDAYGGKAYDALQSVFARGTYDFGNKYLATVTFRTDGSSKFGPNNRWAYFPAFSVGWRISEEPFFESLTNAVSSLKITGGWGQLGNQSIDRLQYLALISSGYRYSFGDQPTVGTAQSSIANSNVKWERAEMTNVSIEAGLLQNQVLATVSYFDKQTKDMLLKPPSLGSNGTASVPFQNVGQLENKGVEVEISYRKTTGAFSYTLSGNATYISNKVIKLYNGNFLASQLYGRSSQEISRTYEGQPIGTFYGWKTNGLYQNQSEINSDPNISEDPRR